MSFGGPFNQVLDAAILQTRKRNVVLVAAVGNQGPAKKPLYPASHKQVVAVTAINLAKRPYKHANKGQSVEFAAPGVNIKVAYPNNSMSVQSGTSYSTPFVTAALAVLKKKTRSVNKARSRLRRSTQDLGTRGKDSVYGWGLIQAHKICR
jgi:subtilisin family serine protease